MTNPNNNYHTISGKGKVQFTDEEQTEWEADQAINLASKHSRDAEKQIVRIEAQVTNRRLRDAVAGTENPKGWLSNQEALIAVQREILSKSLKNLSKDRPWTKNRSG